jgi:hypothetical protein
MPDGLLREQSLSKRGSLGVQFGAEVIDIVILSMGRSRRSKLLSDRFAIDSDAAAAWGNGKAAHGDPMRRSSFFRRCGGRVCGFRP